MYTFIKRQGVKNFLRGELPSLSIALLIAEAFYEFGSFLAECMTFLVTWFIISFLWNTLLTKLSTKKIDMAETDT